MPEQLPNASGNGSERHYLQRQQVSKNFTSLQTIIFVDETCGCVRLGHRVCSCIN